MRVSPRDFPQADIEYIFKEACACRTSIVLSFRQLLGVLSVIEYVAVFYMTRVMMIITLCPGYHWMLDGKGNNDVDNEKQGDREKLLFYTF